LWRTAIFSQPAQVNLPPVPQLLLEKGLAALLVALMETAAEISLRLLPEPQAGQSGVRSASEKRRICSNSSPQSVQWNAYNGIWFHLILFDTIPQYSIIIWVVKDEM